MLKIKRPLSLSIKLWLAMTLLILAVLGGLGVTITWLFGDFYLHQKLDALSSEANELAGQMAPLTTWSERVSTIQSFKLSSGTQLVLLDATGNTLAVMGTSFSGGPRGAMGWGGGMGGPMSGWGRALKPTDFFSANNLLEVLAGNTLSIKALPTDGSGQAMLISAAPIGNKPVTGVVLLGSSPVPIQESINTFRRIILYTSLLAVFLATLISLLLARQMTKPLALMQKGASRMAKGDFQPILGVNSRDELGELAGALNFMGESLHNHVAWLSQEKNLLEGIIEGISDAVIMLGKDGELLYANDPARALWQTDDQEQVSRKEEILGFLRQLISNETSEEAVARTLTLGTQILQVGMASLAENDGIRGHVIVLRDITASLRAEKERRDFLASVTHELRTPLHLIQGYLEAIQDGVIPEEDEAENINLVLEETRRLARLVQGLQDINRLERGQSLQPTSFSAGEFLQDLKQRFQGRAGDLGINLIIQPLEVQLVVDRDRFLQVFINLLDNALRYTPSGRTVLVSVEELPDSLRFMVKDEGEGMSSEALSHIFERFYRVDKARSRREGGMGLGLAIVKQIVEAHGGNIRVESELGKGSTFWLEMPKN
ncbi:MAG: HAMP domain-containing sensor histidine kinase [Desulfitobacteriaceae bacterium]